jgi:hypothetical protein
MALQQQGFRLPVYEISKPPDQPFLQNLANKGAEFIAKDSINRYLEDFELFERSIGQYLTPLMEEFQRRVTIPKPFPAANDVVDVLKKVASNYDFPVRQYIYPNVWNKMVKQLWLLVMLFVGVQRLSGLTMLYYIYKSCSLICPEKTALRRYVDSDTFKTHVPQSLRWNLTRFAS